MDASIKTNPRTKRNASIFIVALILAGIALTFLIGGSSPSLVGNWKVEEYKIGGETITTGEISAYMGESFAQYNDLTFTLNPSGSVDISTPNLSTGAVTASRGQYLFEGNILEIYSDSNTSYSETLTYSRGSLILDMGNDIEVILKKQ